MAHPEEISIQQVQDALKVLGIVDKTKAGFNLQITLYNVILSTEERAEPIGDRWGSPKIVRTSSVFTLRDGHQPADQCRS